MELSLSVDQGDALRFLVDGALGGLSCEREDIETARIWVAGRVARRASISSVS
jgi:hypothetical protein